MKPRLYDALKGTYGGKKGKESEKRLAASGYSTNERLSGKRVRVYHNAAENKTVVAVRGTHSYADALISDPAVALGLLPKTKRYKHAQHTYDKVLKEYGDSKVTVVGHSLGGSIASDLKTRNDDQKITYNKGAGPRFLTGQDKNKKNEIALRNPGDLVSGFSSVAGGTKNVGRSYLNPLTSHSLSPIRNRPLFL